MNFTDPMGLKDRGWPVNGRVINRSGKDVTDIDIDNWNTICVKQKSKSPRFGQDVDFVQVKSTWYKIGIGTFVIDESGNPPSGFDKASPEDLIDINNVFNRSDCAKCH